MFEHTMRPAQTIAPRASQRSATSRQPSALCRHELQCVVRRARVLPRPHGVLRPLAVALVFLVGSALVQQGAHGARPEDPGLDPATASKLRRSLDDASVAIIVIDAARADHLGCYGYPRDTTPNIDRLAAGSVLFGNHHCQVPRTRGSTASLFTGQFPDTHGIVYNLTESTEPDFTLASAFSRAGHRTALFSSNLYASPYMHVGTHFEESYCRDPRFTEGPGFSPPELLKQLKNWLSANVKSRFLIYLHFLPPHGPYDAPAEITGLFEGQTPPGYNAESYSPLKFDFPIGDLRVVQEYPPLPGWLNLYDANLRYADWAVGELLALLDGAGILEQTLVIVTSDHGEAFGEHGYIWHEHAIHDEVSHIPLIMRFPGRHLSGRRIGCLTQTIDLLPTLCDLFGIPFEAADIQGQTLVPVLAGLASSAAEYTVVKSFHPEKYMVREQEYAMVIYRDWKWHALYDLRNDPQQRHNIIVGQHREAKRLLRIFSDHARHQRHSPEPFVNWWPVPRPTPGAMDKDLRKALEALGYLK